MRRGDLALVAGLFVALACAHCGAATALDGTASALDAACGDDATQAADAGPGADVVLLDHGTNGFTDAPAAALPACVTQSDCDGWATCQQGLCCAGTLVDGGVCLCGESPGCDLRHTCCVPFTSTTQIPECVSDCVSQCGCSQPPS